MAAILGRVMTAFNPPVTAKYDDAIKFGILGAANIG
jgi:hypothetical protein